MKIEKEGEEIEVFTADEVTAKANEAVEAAKAEATTALQAKEAELAEARKLLAEKNDNFQKYNEMTEEQKKAFDANTTNLLKRIDAATTEVETLKKTLSDKEVRERDSAKTGALSSFHGGKEDVKKVLEEKYALLAAMPETTQEEINARATAAARLAGISIDSRNPLYSPINGEAPRYKDTKEYVETPEGKEAAQLVRQAMGLPEPK